MTSMYMNKEEREVILEALDYVLEANVLNWDQSQIDVAKGIPLKFEDAIQRLRANMRRYQRRLRKHKKQEQKTVIYTTEGV